jgi:hypothetical protein
MPRSVPMQPHLGSVVSCLLLHNMVGFKVLQNFYATCGESVQPLQSVNYYSSRAHGQERPGPSHD